MAIFGTEESNRVQRDAMKKAVEDSSKDLTITHSRDDLDSARIFHITSLLEEISHLRGRVADLESKLIQQYEEQLEHLR